jgi:circadian clock protein KaiB
MKRPDQRDRAEGAETREKPCVFKLFVAGDERNSRLARENLKRFCEKYLNSRYEIEIVDVLQDFKSALENNVFLTPALIVISDLTYVTIFGTLSDAHKVLSALQLAGGAS